MSAGDEARGIKAGFIGLGRMGANIAGRIAERGYALTVWARRPEAMEALAPKGARAAASAAEVGATCDYVGLCVLDDAAVAQVCESLLPAMRPGSVLAIHSTILPESCERLEVRCAERGILFADAPVDGGPWDAAAGTLTVACGATPAAYARVQPLLESFAKLVVHVGGAGAGQRTKLICNGLLAADLGLARAAMMLGDAYGLERGKLYEVVSNSSGMSKGFEIYRSVEGTSTTPMLHKDLTLMHASAPSDRNVGVIAAAARNWLDFNKPE